MLFTGCAANLEQDPVKLKKHRDELAKKAERV
jgi:hypothetical protein